MAAEECAYIWGMLGHGGGSRDPGVGWVYIYTDTSIFRGFVFIDSGSWAFKQRVVPCVNPIL